MPRIASAAALLKRGKWTGEQVGKLLIANLCNDFENIGNPNKTPLYDQFQLEELVAGLADEKDYICYNVYRSLFTSIRENFYYSHALLQKFENGYNRIFSRLGQIQYAEISRNYETETPLIMYQSQYDRLRKKAIEELKNRPECFSDLIFYVLQKCLEIDFDAPQNVLIAIDATRAVSAKEIAFSEKYNVLEGRGYNSLPDGRRSDQMSAIEWSKAIAKEQAQNPERDRQKRFKQSELFFKGAKAIRSYVKERTGKSLTGTDEDIEKQFCDLFIDIRPAPPQDPNVHVMEGAFTSPLTEWTFYKELPYDLNAYDLLFTLINTYGGEDRQDYLQTLQTEYPNLYAELKSYVEAKITLLHGLDPNRYFDPLISWGDLANAGVVGYASRLDPNDQDIADIWTDGDDSTQAMIKRLKATHGIAILRDPPPELPIKGVIPEELQQNSDYFETDLIHYFRELNDVDNLMRDKTQLKNLNRFARELMNSAISQICAYNKLIDILANVYGLPELKKKAKVDLSVIQKRFDSFNIILHYLYQNVYGSQTDKQRKRDFIKENFTDLNLDIFKPTRTAINQVTIMLQNLGMSYQTSNALQVLTGYINILSRSEKGSLYGLNGA